MTHQDVAHLLDLSEKVAIVTGGAIGIGQAVALRLAEAGATVMITDINLEGGNRTAEQIVASGGKAQAILADASSCADAKRTARATMQAFGRLDILVNNAGVYPLSPTLDMSEESWDRVLDTNLKGMFFYSQAAAHEMIKAGRGGKIINLASTAGLHPNLDRTNYDASKGGVIMLTKSLALNLAGYNILVNAVAPGATETPGNQGMLDMVQSSEEIAKAFWARAPMGRMARPDDIAKVVLFLASAAADYMTGSLVVVDGGLLLT